MQCIILKEGRHPRGSLLQKTDTAVFLFVHKDKAQNLLTKYDFFFSENFANRSKFWFAALNVQYLDSDPHYKVASGWDLGANEMQIHAEPKQYRYQ
jgi:hypothetical protein